MTFLQAAAFKDFLTDFKKMGGVEVYFAGNGEPFLNLQLPQFIQDAYDVGLDITLSTNGVFLDEKLIPEVVPYIKWIRYSVNGGDAETYARVHRTEKSDFTKLVKNIKHAAKFRDTQKLDVKLIIQFIVYEINWHSLDDLTSMYRAVNADVLSIRNVFFNKRKARVKEKRIIEVLERIEAAGEDENIFIRWDTFAEDKGPLTWAKCYGINFRTNMDDRGNLYTCSRMFYAPSIYGNIHEISFAKIWKSRQKKDLFNTIEHDWDKEPCKDICQVSFDNVVIDQLLKSQESQRAGG
jgi:radical SAM protein with 4Fe4S-binding SPASM domain